MKKTMKHLPTLVAMVLFSALAIAAGLPPSGSGVASVEPITLDTVNVRVGINDTTPDHPFDVEVGGEEQLRVESDGDVCLDDDGGSCTLRVDAANNFVYTQTLLPRLDDTYYLGTAGAGWRGLRLSANGAITFGDGSTQTTAPTGANAVGISGYVAAAGIYADVMTKVKTSSAGAPTGNLTFTCRGGGAGAGTFVFTMGKFSSADVFTGNFCQSAEIPCACPAGTPYTVSCSAGTYAAGEYVHVGTSIAASSCTTYPSGQLSGFITKL